METPLAWLALCAPAALSLVALAARRRPGRAPERVIATARAASVVGLLVAVASAALVAWWGPLVTPTLGLDDVGLALRLDALSVSMLALVAGLGAAVLRFAERYLEGNARHGSFLGLLAATIASVMLLVLSGNVAQLALMWFLTSLALHRLLLFHPDRTRAVVAARKKWIVARLGDVCLAAAAVLLIRTFGTGDIGRILATAAASAGEAGPALHAAAALVALSAALKSAQFPTHGWLAEVMETPTPVSALLHAGILNGGTFLIVRLGDVIVLSEPTLHALILVGGLTSVFASVVMITQTSVKVVLAYSSAAHMGFMLFLCGIGAFPVAILHLIAHSFYKAHAFLTAGGAVEALRATREPSRRAPPTPREIGVAFAAALLGVLATGAVFGADPLSDPVTLGLCGVLALGLTQLVTPAVAGRPARALAARCALAGLATTVAFFGLEKGAAAVLAGSVPAAGAVTTGTTVLMSAVVLVYALATLLQLRLPALRASPAWAGVWVHVRNGLYANALFDRLVRAHGASAPTRSPSSTTEFSR